LVVRVDLAYLKQFLFHKTIQSFHNDLSTFRYQIAKNKDELFNGLIFMLGLLSKAKRIKVITAMLYLFLMEPNGMMVKGLLNKLVSYGSD
jgi:hypothetical protein